jgi:hypothetical protein
VAQPVPELPADVRPLVQGVHLVDADVLELLLMALEHVEEADRLAVGERDDHVGARTDVVQHALRCDRRGQTSRHVRMLARMGGVHASAIAKRSRRPASQRRRWRA